MKRSYFYREIFMFKVFGVSLTGSDSIFYKIYVFFLLFVFDYPYPFLASKDWFQNNIDETLDTAAYTMGCYIGIIEMVMVLKNRKRIMSLINRLQEEPFLPNPERGGENVEETLIGKCLRVTSRQSRIYYTVMGLIAFPGVALTISKRIKSNDYRDWEFIYGPFNVLNVTYSPNFEISWFYQTFAITTIGFNAASTTLITTSLLAHISTQFKILQNFLERIAEHSYLRMMKDRNNLRELTTYNKSNGEVDVSKIPWNYLQKSLKEAILYHISIANFANETVELFSELVMFIYLIILVVLCVFVYNASILDMQDVTAISKVIVGVIGTMVPVFLISYWGEQVSTESGKLQFAAYQANFIGADLRFQKGLALIIKRCQDPVKIKAGKIIETSLVTLAWMIRTSYSSLMVLRKHNKS